MTGLRYIDVCSGISAPTMAWKPLGWKALCFAEIEAAPRGVLAHHYPDVPLNGDFTKIRGDEYGPVDLLVGGTPCQSFSVAGLRGGLADERGNLALEYLRLADRARPRWLVWENVPGVLSSSGGRDFGTFLGGLAQLGYGFAYRVLDAQFFGVPQRRRRVFVVGYLGDWRRAAAVLFERRSLQGDPPPRREAGEAAPTIPSRSSAGGGLGTDFDCDGGLVVGANQTTGFPGDVVGTTAHRMVAFGEYDDDGTASSLKARDYKDATDLVAHSLRGEGFDASEDGTGRGTPLVPVAYNLTPSNSNKDFNAREASYAQALTGFGGRPSARGGDLIAFTAKDHGADAGDVSPTLRGGGHNGSHANGGVMPAGAHHSAVRRLTPRECERLQGFPDDFTLVPYRNGIMADGPRYKMLGNSMAVPVVRWIGERIAAVEALSETVAA